MPTRSLSRRPRPAQARRRSGWPKSTPRPGLGVPRRRSPYELGELRVHILEARVVPESLPLNAGAFYVPASGLKPA